MSSGPNDDSWNCIQIKMVMPVEIAFSDTFVGIINLPKGNPRDLKKRQFAAVSITANTIAACPPSSNKVKKTSASEKLIANFDLGSGRLLRGATRMPKEGMKRYPHVNADEASVEAAATVQIP